MVKRRKVSFCDKFWRTATRFDLFGEQVKFNLDGKESFDTCCGSLVTLLIFLVVAVYGLFLVRLYQKEHIDLPILVDYLQEGYYEDPVEIRQDTNDFYFAIAVSSK